MNKILGMTVTALTVLSTITAAFAQLDGKLPIPDLGDVKVEATASVDATTGIYRYAYIITNPPDSTGEIEDVYVDITSPPQTFGDPDALTIMFIRGQRLTFRQMLDEAPSNQVNVMPVGVDVPPGWYGDIYARGVATFSSDMEEGGTNIAAGETRSGFVLTSFGSPTLREMTIVPDWIYVSEGSISEEQEQRGREIAESIKVRRLTLGPSPAFPGSVEQWNRLRDDLRRMIELGWINDAALAQALTAQLAEARAARDAFDGTLARARLQTLLEMVGASTPAQRRAEVHDLVALNAQSLIAHTADTPVGFEPKVRLDPAEATLPLGASYELTASVINLADADRPIPGFRLQFQLTAGPHAPQQSSQLTDGEGKATFFYEGTATGTDTIAVFSAGGELLEGTVQVIWNGAPDMVVPVFSPPVIESQGGNTVFVHDITGNVGTLPSSATLTRYYITDTPAIDLATAAVLGERIVPALPPEALDHGELLTFTIPPSLPAGPLYLAACADDTHELVELDETNNCSFNSVEGFASVVLPMRPSENQPPHCSQAAPVPSLLWPPNHKLTTVRIEEVTDPEGDPFAVRVTAITQDEPVNALGDGNTQPDGFGVGTSAAKLRAERSGTGNGRVYRIAFTAEDGRGGMCSGAVNVGVPHDQGQGSVPIDDGQLYDSTVP